MTFAMVHLLLITCSCEYMGFCKRGVIGVRASCGISFVYRGETSTCILHQPANGVRVDIKNVCFLFVSKFSFQKALLPMSVFAALQNQCSVLVSTHMSLCICKECICYVLRSKTLHARMLILQVYLQVYLQVTGSQSLALSPRTSWLVVYDMSLNEAGSSSKSTAAP
jgi:hypothetical protein